MDDQHIRAVVQTQIIECLNRFYAIETGMWGGPLHALIIRTVIAGENQGRLYDISAIANVLDLPLTTVHRKVRELEEMRFLYRQRDGRSAYLRPTQRTCVKLDKSFEEMIRAVRLLYRMPSPQTFLKYVVDAGPHPALRFYGEMDDEAAQTH